MHWINNSVCICLTVLSAFHYQYSTEMLYQDLCAKGITSPLPTSEVYAVTFVDNWVIPGTLPLCVTNELRPHHVCLWQSVLPLCENESGISHSKFPLFLLNWPNLGVCILGGTYITSNLHAFGFSVEFIHKFISHKFICLPSSCFPDQCRIRTL